ncbi:MAG: glycosyltransferase family 4 protein [Thermoanaerobaculia bacterium]
MVDALVPGGLERVAVNLANSLPRSRYRVHLCTTRQDGSLEAGVSTDVERLRLRKSGRFDPVALHRLVRHVRANDIRLIHAHGTSLFLAAVAAAFRPRPVVVWHDHFGRFGSEERPVGIYGPAARRAGGVIAVSEALAGWSRGRLGVRPECVYYIPNFVLPPEQSPAVDGLPGSPGSRIVCVANFRRQKDHLGLVRAMTTVVRSRPEAHLLLVGESSDRDYEGEVRNLVSAEGLDRNVSILGFRNDVAGVLHACDLGVLSSTSEGFPLALIEYGWASLPAVATCVGQCEEILDGGRAGVLVPCASPEKLAEALVGLLVNADRRQELGKRLRDRVEREYGRDRTIERVCDVYEAALRTSRDARASAKVS